MGRRGRQRFKAQQKTRNKDQAQKNEEYKARTNRTSF